MSRFLSFLAFAFLYLLGAAGLLVWIVVWIIPSILLLELRLAIKGGKPPGARAPGYLPKWTTDRMWSVSDEKNDWERAFNQASRGPGLTRRAGGLHGSSTAAPGSDG